MTPGQIWLAELPLGGINSRGFGVVKGEVGGVLNPFVNVDETGTLRVMSSTYDEKEHVRYFDASDSIIKAADTEYSALQFCNLVLAATGVAFSAGGSWLHTRFTLDDVTFKLNML